MLRYKIFSQQGDFSTKCSAGGRSMYFFEYQNQGIFNMTIFDGGPRGLSYWHLLLVSKQKRRFLEY
jgi:hypothetical protein